MMPKNLMFQLDETGQAALEMAMKTDPRPEVRQRAMALRLLQRGESVAGVASVVAVTSASIYGWIHRWEAEGVAGLANRPKRPGRRKVTPAYCAALETALASEPSSFGYPFAIWTLERLRDHLIRQTGIRLTVQWLSVVLDELGYVYRRPKHDLTHLQNVQAKQAALELLDELKKGHTMTLSSSSLWTKQR